MTAETEKAKLPAEIVAAIMMKVVEYGTKKFLNHNASTELCAVEAAIAQALSAPPAASAGEVEKAVEAERERCLRLMVLAFQKYHRNEIKSVEEISFEAANLIRAYAGRG